MFFAVVPARNEAGRIGIVLSNLLKTPVEAIIPVVNGCTDATVQEVALINDTRVKPIYFDNPLGIDVPRAVGAAYALKLGASGIIFVDGDMTGDFHSHLNCLLASLANGTDLALVNCYPYITNRQKLASLVLHFRGRLNRELGLFQSLGLASPAHGPHGISRKLLDVISITDLALPPMVLVKAKRHKLNIKVVTSIPHLTLSSPVRERGHARKVAHTIIGDCLEALCVTRGLPVSRSYGKHTFDGYNSSRRLDLLAKWQTYLDLQALPTNTQAQFIYFKEPMLLPNRETR